MVGSWGESSGDMWRPPVWENCAEPAPWTEELTGRAHEQALGELSATEILSKKQYKKDGDT